MSASIPSVIRRVLIVAALSLSAGVCLADCQFRDGGAVHTVMPLLGVNLTVGRDTPLGSEIYRQTFRVPVLTGVVCSAGVYQSTLVRRLVSLPLPLSDWSGTPYSGKVYETGVHGIGIAVAVSGIGLPFNQARDNCGGGTQECYVAYQDGMAFDVTLIKIGEVSPGTILGSLLPTMGQQWVSSNILELQTVSMTGAINIVSRTCDTPDVHVTLGTRRLDEFSGVGTATPWRDFAISLLNCPAFQGFYRGTGPRWFSDGRIENIDSRTNNTLRYRLDPTEPPIDPLNGVISLAMGRPGGPPSAQGVGIQLADGRDMPIALGVLQDSGIDTAAVSGGAYSIPLRARYLQTAPSVTPGPANGSLVFTLNYQ